MMSRVHDYAKQASPRTIPQTPQRGMRLPTAAEIMREPCLYCGANIGEPCTGRGYRPMRGFHAKRMRLAAYIPNQ